MAKTKQEVATDLLSNFIQNIRDGFETDKNLEIKDGVEFDYGRYGRFLCKRAVNRNSAYSKAMRDKIVPYIESRGDAEESDDTGNRKMAEVYVDTIIIGIKTPDGQEIPYNDAAKKALVALFVDAPDMFIRLQSDVSNAANFRKKRVEENSKN